MDKERMRQNLRVELSARGMVAGDTGSFIRDLSESGMFVSCSTPLRHGQEVTCKFYLPFSDGSRHLIEMRAEVRHSTVKYAFGAGLRFLRLSAEDLSAIRRYLHENKTRAVGLLSEKDRKGAFVRKGVSLAWAPGHRDSGPSGTALSGDDDALEALSALDGILQASAANRKTGRS